MKINNILTIDDARYEENIKKIFAGVDINAELHVARDVEEAIIYLEKSFTNGDMPEVILFDTACPDKNNGYRDYDYDWGCYNFRIVQDWYKSKGLEDKFPHAMFQSADYTNAKDSADWATRKYGLKTYAFDQHEPKKCAEFLGGDEYGYKPESKGFREFMNTVLGHRIPLVNSEFKAGNNNKEIKIKDLFNSVAENKITKEEALKKIKLKAKETAKNDMLDKILFPEGADIKGVGFKAYTEDAISGVAAFSIEEIRKYKYMGKEPILVMDSYNANIVPFFKDLSGLVMLSPSGTGHLRLLLKGFNVSGLLGASNLGSDEHYPFLKNPDGSDFTHAMRLEKEEDISYLADYSASVLDLAMKHRMKHCPDSTLTAKGFDLSNVPDLIVDIDNMKPDKKIYSGDGLAIDSNGSLYKGDYKIKRGDLNNERHHWITKVLDWLREESGEVTGHHIKFKASLDYPEQDYNKYKNDGIGLIRTEHFVLSQKDQQVVLKHLLLEQDSKSFKKFSYGLQQDLVEDIFSDEAVLNNKPKRIRLLDMPINELSLTEEEQNRFESLYGCENIRGVQLAEKYPAIYEAQLRGVFSAMKKNKETNALENYANVEIMVPTVKTEGEVAFVKQLARERAREFGIPESAYKFGVMVETIDACKNIESIVKHCDFISMGTNDLTSEVHKCPRDDYEAREELSLEKGYDPFVIFTKEVLSLVRSNIKKARSVNPGLQIDVCGDHATNLDNLVTLTKCDKDLNINGVSVPPSPKNLIDLRLNHDFEFLDRRRSGIICVRNKDKKAQPTV